MARDNSLWGLSRIALAGLLIGTVSHGLSESLAAGHRARVVGPVKQIDGGGNERQGPAGGESTEDPRVDSARFQGR